MFEELKEENLTFEEDAQMYLSNGASIFIIDTKSRKPLYEYALDMAYSKGYFNAYIYISGENPID
jgi:hypothetical protein